MRLFVQSEVGLNFKLRTVVEGLPAHEARAKTAVIRHLVSADIWQKLREEYGLPGERSGQIVVWDICT